MFLPTDILSAESWVLFATILGLLWFYIHRKWQYFSKLNIPHEPPSVLKFGSIAKSFSEPFTIDNESKSKYGPVWGFYFLTQPTIMVHDLDILRQIYISEFANFPIRQDRLTEIFGKELKEALTIKTGDDWKRVRSTISPTFSTSKIKGMIEIIDWCTENSVQSMERKVKGCDGVFNPRDFFSRLSLDIVCSAAFSTKVHSQDDTQEDPEVIIQAKKIFAAPMGPLFILCFLFPTLEKICVKLGIFLMPKSSSKFFKELAKYIMEERRKNPDQERRVDLMQLMMDAHISAEEVKKGAKKGLTEEEIVGNCILMILAGYDNTSNTMGFLSYNLAFHPEVQTKLQEEIDEMMATRGKMDYEGINSLKYLDMCLNESLRLYSPIMRNARICTKETVINGIIFHKGISVGIPTYGLSHDPEFWQDPFEFKPERMRDMNEIDPMVYQPFGAGPRNCVGMRFAIIEVKMVICKLLYKFTIKPCDDTPKPPLKLKFGTSIKSDIDYNLCAVPR